MKKICLYLDKIEIDLCFKILYLLLGLLTFNSIVANGNLLTVFSYVLTAIGGLCFLKRIINYKNYIESKGLLLLVLFLISHVISSIFTIKYGIVGNIKALIWLGMQFFLLYAYDVNATKEKIKKEVSIL